MNRRELMSWFSLGWVASFLPVAMAACSPTEKAESDSQNSGKNTSNSSPDGFASVGTVSQLEEKGEILNREFAGGAVLVIGNPDDPAMVKAVNPTCTHDGCTVKWHPRDKKYICPCHDAEYSADGRVLQGPAKEPLSTYAVKIAGDSVLVKSF